MGINKTYTSFFKPIADFSLALIFIILLSPIFLMVSLALLCFAQPVFFKQYRPGLNGKLFEVYKFTSMVNENENAPFVFGKFLRRSSLDELPQLINILKGEMSFIGPRPLLSEYLNRYTSGQSKRHLVKPGITGWAQVNGRNVLSLGEKVEFDLFYVSNVSLLFDLKIVFMTFIQLVKWEESDYHQVALKKPKDIRKIG